MLLNCTDCLSKHCYTGFEQSQYLKRRHAKHTIIYISISIYIYICYTGGRETGVKAGEQKQLDKRKFAC